VLALRSAAAAAAAPRPRPLPLPRPLPRPLPPPPLPPSPRSPPPPPPCGPHGSSASSASRSSSPKLMIAGFLPGAVEGVEMGGGMRGRARSRQGSVLWLVDKIGADVDATMSKGQSSLHKASWFLRHLHYWPCTLKIGEATAKHEARNVFYGSIPPLTMATTPCITHAHVSVCGGPRQGTRESVVCVCARLPPTLLPPFASSHTTP